jgi:MipA family protein
MRCAAGIAIAIATAAATAMAVADEPPNAAPAARSQKPLWELGFGAAGLRLPHYRGSDQAHNWLLPLPYFVYRGPIFRADRDGARAVLLETSRFDLDLSLAAGAPTRSDDNRARAGMPDLAPTLEIGPNLNWTLARTADWKLALRAPVRAVFTLDSDARWIGWSATPNLNFDHTTLLPGWNLGLQAAPVFGSRQLHAYYYDVDATQATAGRPEYRSGGGFAGAQLTAALSRRFGRAWLGLFARLDTVRSATFADSPLVKQRDNVAFGVAFAWVFSVSEQTVLVPD